MYKFLQLCQLRDLQKLIRLVLAVGSQPTELIDPGKEVLNLVLLPVSSFAEGMAL